MGQTLSLFSQLFPPASHFSVHDIPDLTGRIALVTGGNAGIGKETVRALLEHNATVYLAARSRSRAEETILELKQSIGKEAQFLLCDLASMESVRGAAQEFMSKETELHMLFNNGGVLSPPIDQLTVEGIDLQWGVNVVGHALLTFLLLPALLSGAKSSPDGKARVVNTSSIASYGDIIHWDSFLPGEARDKMGSRRLYMQSKHGNIVFARELGRRYGDSIISTAVNPGNIRTTLYRHYPSLLERLALSTMYPPPTGALTQLWAGTSHETIDFNGKFLIPFARVGECRAEANDPEVGSRLWAYLEEVTTKP
ncbi:hypothetical protein HETIRDRAFT_325583 [Heterobasidion irregulare TC 32-1]|uniref:NAD(P)-binding protein n=1 Tax=Heterobasidion irregulare (strain TC 32-1) TaxID=747525 RepID=W4JZG0_HETIT|nr:uncharacterized protein HETIRDRAFT_325583 [Heterobasidion irregulare TC 32-1]ETW78251.1 hypothetical protein HETIRDRAFT_325583 [Heterobasidion irregulare TC 32-1]